MSQKATVKAVVDYREPEHVWDEVKRHPDVESMQLDDLPAADIVIGDVGFERKTPADFASSMTNRDDHLRNQVAKMRESFAVSYILIEGDMADFKRLEHTRVATTALRGFIASIEMRQQVRVMFCSDIRGLVDMAVRLARKRVETDASSVLRVDSATGLDAPFVERVYGLIDGVGPKTADTLHKEFPTLSGALAASEEDLQAIDGVGPKTAQTIHQTLRGK